MSGLDPNNDPRVGSSRDNSTATTVTAVTTGSNSASFASLFTTLIPVTVYAVICLAIFFTLRRKCQRVYSPRTIENILPPHERSAKLPSGWFNWIKPFVKLDDTYVLNHVSLDGFLFLRYMKILCVICLVGCCITWPVLMPLHVHGGRGNTQLDCLTFGNVANPNWYFVHAVQAWLFFGFILYMVSRECVYYINLRQAYLLSPYYANRLSSRTVLFGCVPQAELDEARLRKVFGDAVKNVWISSDTKELDQLVKERAQTALRLEKAEIVLIKKANAARNKLVQTGHPDLESNVEPNPASQSREAVAVPDPENIISPAESSGSDGQPSLKTYGYTPPPDINGSVASQWLSHTERPRHRPLANYGRRVDTIKWTRLRLKQLTPKINKLRKYHRSGKDRAIPAVFIEFDSQVNAQSAYQALAHHRAMHMSPRFIGVRPYEIVWSCLRMRWWERIIRRFLIQAFVTVLIIFWSIPCAIIGIISNVKFLSSKVSFLGWIDDLPSPILGLISGLLPAVALSFLMSLVPAIMRKCAKAAGVPSLSMIELFCQNAYFVFQVVQVFLITTLTSAASAAFTQILEDPLSTKTLLSANLPKASNFYVSYFILQGLATSASHLVHFSALFRHQILANSSDNPRFLSTRWHRLRRIHWGGIYPVFTNMSVIAISYACIAPITLGFAGAGFFLVYASYRYNLIYVYDSEIDTKGLLYPRALKQTLTGVYLAEICLIGLFSIGGAFGPIFLMIMLLVFTALIHISLNDALGPLLYNLPKTLAVDEHDSHLPPTTPAKNSAAASDVEKFGSQPEYDWPESIQPQSLDPDAETGPGMDFEPGLQTGPETTRGIEGAEGAADFVSSSLMTMASNKLKSTIDLDAHISRIDFWTRWISPDPAAKPNFLIKWLHPEVYADYTVLRRLIEAPPPQAEQSVHVAEEARDAYFPPSMVVPAPVLWIPRDVGGVSAQEVAHTAKVIGVTDEGAWLNEKNRIEVDLEGVSPVVLERIRY